jgi:hypothetical protein
MGGHPGVDSDLHRRRSLHRDADAEELNGRSSPPLVASRHPGLSKNSTTPASSSAMVAGRSSASSISKKSQEKIGGEVAYEG